MSDLELLLLSPPQIKTKGEQISLPRRKALALLVYLVINERSYPRETLATLFWPELDQSSALAQLRNVLSSIRKSLGYELIRSLNETLCIQPGNDIRLDVNEFKQFLFSVRNHHHPPGGCASCRAELEQAVRLYRGDFMEGFNLPDCPDFDDWQFFLREGLRSDLAAALQILTQQHVLSGDTQAAISCTRHWLSLDSLHEPAHCTLMRLYAHAGQRSAALRQYSECEKILQQELGVLPQPSTHQLYQDILDGRETAVSLDVPILISELSRSRHNLPIQTIPFVQREDVMPQILARLDDPNCRLLNLVGPGGCGKTRLAVEAGALLLDKFPDGVFFVSLEPLASLDAIVPTIAEAVGFSFYQAEIKPRQQLLNFLTNKKMLLILDNFEHLLKGVGLAVEILQAAPGVEILATSRARLNVYEELVLPIPGMPRPAAGEKAIALALAFSSIRLFLQSARWAQPRFALTDDNLPLVTCICRMLEGMPLGILLAAAWLRLLPLEEIANELESGLDLLAGDLRDLPERQRSLRAVFDRSWGMLPERVQGVFAALSVFRGGCSREAAREVSRATLYELLRLTDRSLLQRDASGRFSMHRLLRQYAAERLAESTEEDQAAHSRHTAYFAAQMTTWGNELKSSSQGKALDEMDVEIKNCRGAWEWAGEQKELDSLAAMQEGLFLYHSLRFRNEEGKAVFRGGAARLSEVLSAQAIRLRCGFLARLGAFMGGYEPVENVEEVFDQAQTLLTHPLLSQQGLRQDLADLWRLRGAALRENERHAVAKTWLEKSLPLCRELGNHWEVAEILSNLGVQSWMAGEPAAAVRYFEESLALYRLDGDPSGMGYALLFLGSYKISHAIEEAEDLLRESIAVYRQTKNPWGLQLALVSYAAFGLIIAQGKFHEAEPYLLECEQICNEYGIPLNTALALVTHSYSQLGSGRYIEASQMSASALEIARKHHFPRGESLALNWLGWSRLALGEWVEALECCRRSAALARGDYMPLNEKILSLAGLAAAACLNGSMEEAKRCLLEALEAIKSLGNPKLLFWTLPPQAALLAAQGEAERAVELYTMAHAISPFIEKAKFIKDLFGSRIMIAANSLPSEVCAAAEIRGRTHDPWDTARELLAELKGQV